MYMTQLFNG